MSPRAVLVGPPGAGKTTIGAQAAALLGVAFEDTDHLIEVKAGKPIPEIFFDEGEPAFRVLEQAAITEALATFDGVLALGGGAILHEGTRELLREHTVVF
ncbi:MAG: shikimate kinase, partial [Actinoplanes sp.]